MIRPPPLLLALAACGLLSGCTTHYVVRVDAAPSQSVPDTEVHAEVMVDATGERMISLALTNRTSEPLQVAWTQITVVRPDGRSASLRPDADLGWVLPGATQTARLSPFSLPDRGDAALAYRETRFELRVPMTVRHEPTVYRVALQAHVTEKEGGR